MPSPPAAPWTRPPASIQPVLEKELGTNVEVINKPGAGGQIGYTALTSAKPDGYTIGATGSPSVVVSPLDPARGAKYTRASFQPLGRQVIDPAVIAVQPGQPLQDAEGPPGRGQGQPEVTHRQHHRHPDR